MKITKFIHRIVVLLGSLLLLFYCCFCFCISLCMRTMQREKYAKIVHKNTPYLPLSTIADENGYIIPLPESSFNRMEPAKSHPKYVVPDITNYQPNASSSSSSSTTTIIVDNDSKNPFAPGYSESDAQSPVQQPSSSLQYDTMQKPGDKKEIKLMSMVSGDGDDDDESDLPPPPYNPNVSQHSKVNSNDDNDDDDDNDESDLPPPPYNPNVNQFSKVNEDSDEDDDADENSSLLPPPPPYNPNLN